jgi:hypothetical protein
MVAFSGTLGGPASAAQSLNISNGGTRPLSGLSISVSYQSGQPSGWLSASLSGTTAPATVTFSASAGSLAAGTYNATAAIASTASGVTNSAQTILVTFSVSTPSVRTGDVTSVVVNDGKYNAFPGLTRLPNGHLIVVYRKASGHTVSSDGTLYSRISTDQGRTWSSEVFVYSSSVADARDAEIILLSSGKLLLSISATNTTSLTSNVYTMLGTPAGDTVSWDSAKLLNDGFTLDRSVSSKAIELSNGNILLPIYGTNTGDTVASSAVVTNLDRGNTWSTKRIVASGAGEEYDETNGVQLPSGRIVLVIRHDIGAAGYARVFSDDNGVTWSSPANVINQAANLGRPSVLLLGSGGLFLLARAPGNLTGYAVSWDQGATWAPFTTISGGQYVYGSSVLQFDGSIATVYATQTSASDAGITYQDFIVVPRL